MATETKIETPTVEETPAVTEVSNEKEKEFEAIAGELMADDGDIPEEIVEEESTTPAEEPKKPEAAKVLPESQDELKTPEPVVADDPKAPAENLKEAEVPVVEPVVEPVVDEAVVKQQYEQRRTVRVAEFEREYAIPADQIEALQLNPETVLPKFAAQLRMDIEESVANMMNSQMATVMEGVQTQKDTMRQQEDAFYNAWPALKGQDEVVLKRITANYRQLNPGVDQQTMIREVGAQVAISLGIPIDMKSGKIQESVDAVPIAPHNPAGVGTGATHPVTAPPKSGQFELLSQEFLDEDKIF